MSALRTAANIFFPDPFHQIRHPETSIPLLKLLVSLKFKNKLQIFGFHAIIKKALITDFLETGWKHMHKETSDKLLITEGNRTTGITGNSATCAECCMCIRDRNDPASLLMNVLFSWSNPHWGHLSYPEHSVLHTGHFI